ncbi:MAG: DUF1579 family protein [Phycisphaeraceae bacterium]|nr:DUF1579 family protein [Phycisphaeraceae bacterium]
MQIFAVVAVSLLGLFAADPVKTAAPPSRQDPIVLAVDRLSFLVGDWNGDGMLASPEKSVTQKGPWKIEKAFGDRFIRLEFDAVVDGGAGGNNRFVGYFTFDPESKKYRTIWLNVDNSNMQFQETGDLDPEGRTLTLISEQSRKDGTRVKVRSVFHRVDENHVTVEDHPLDEAGKPIRKSFGFDLTR